MYSVFAWSGLSYNSYPDAGTLEYTCALTPCGISAVYWLRCDKKDGKRRRVEAEWIFLVFQEKYFVV